METTSARKYTVFCIFRMSDDDDLEWEEGGGYGRGDDDDDDDTLARRPRPSRKRLPRGQDVMDDYDDGDGDDTVAGETSQVVDAATTIVRMSHAARESARRDTHNGREQERRRAFRETMATFCTPELVKSLVLVENDPDLRIGHIEFMVHRIMQQHPTWVDVDIFLVMCQLSRCIDRVIESGPQAVAGWIRVLLCGVERPNSIKQSIGSYLAKRAAEEVDIERTRVILDPRILGGESMGSILGAAVFNREVVEPDESNGRRQARAARRHEEGT